MNFFGRCVHVETPPMWTRSGNVTRHRDHDWVGGRRCVNAALLGDEFISDCLGTPVPAVVRILPWIGLVQLVIGNRPARFFGPVEMPDPVVSVRGGFMSGGGEAEGLVQADAGRLRGSAVAVGALRSDVEAGRLRLDPAAGREVRELLSEQLGQVDAWLRRAEDLGRRAPLGQNPVGEAMAGKFVDRTTSEGDSFTGVLKEYRRVLDEAREAVAEAMRRYETADEHAVDMFQKLRAKL